MASGLSPGQFSHLFVANAVNGNDDQKLANAFGLDARQLPPPERTSLVSVYETLSDRLMRLYLEREFGFYLPQGCKY